MADAIEKLLPLFREVGRDIFFGGLAPAGAGSLSVLLREDPDYMVITRRGANIGRLGNNDLVRVAIDHDERDAPPTNNELAVHRAIYRQGEGFAVVYALPAQTIALSFYFDQIEPRDGEGKRLLGFVPVLDVGRDAEPADLSDSIAGAANGEQRLAVVRGWGVFATAPTIAEAYWRIALLEHSCRIIAHDLALRGLRNGESI